jgi:hypothetical protein
MLSATAAASLLSIHRDASLSVVKDTVIALSE